MSSFALDQVVKSISAEDADEHFGTIDTELKRIEADLRRQLAVLIRAQNTLANRKKQRLTELQSAASQIVASTIAMMSNFKKMTAESLRDDMNRIIRRRDPMTFVVGPYRYNDLTIISSGNLPPIDESIMMIGPRRNYESCSYYYKSLIKRINEVVADKSATVKLFKRINEKIIIVLRVENSPKYRNDLENYKRQIAIERDHKHKRSSGQTNKRSSGQANKRSNKRKPAQTIDESIEELFALARTTH